MRTRSLLAAGALIGAALLLSACGSDAPGPGDDGPGSTDGTIVGDGNPDHDPCLLGTWQLDVQDVANQLVGLMQMPGASAENEGTVTLTFADSATAAYANTLTLTIPSGGTDMVANAVYSGSTVLDSWAATDGVLTGSDPTGDFAIDMSFTVGGTTIPAPIELPGLGQLGGNVPVNYTCSGDSATLTPPAPAPTWRLTRT